ncbi:hypothetical protein DFR68_10690 [Nocardia mexicana]|uniref:Uncharacterized protein n=1 Tax=Nocardia mexicana TaxID=279262 RepID=A0A370H0U2_9NOCA|nr:hypothetical protein DFR68_10690 [Nocardia mexicana]
MFQPFWIRNQAAGVVDESKHRLTSGMTPVAGHVYDQFVTDTRLFAPPWLDTYSSGRTSR